MKSAAFFAELKRRNVYKVAVAYAVVGWLLVQVATQVFPFFEIPNWAVRLVVLLIIIGCPIALVIAWAFELTPEGIKRTESLSAEEAKQNARSHGWIYVVIVGVILSIGLFFLGRYTASRGVASAPSASAEKSIAVLPFESLSEEKANAYFADGIQDEILARLSQIADLKVISRTSTQKYKSAPTNLREIAQQLGVAHVLEGSVQKSNDQVRVTVQLINASNDAHLWANTYDRKLTDIFGVESEIAKSIADSLQAKLTGREEQALAVKPTNNPEAYEAYLKGLAAEAEWGSVYADEDASRFYEQAVQLDPSFAIAWSRLSRTNSRVYSSANDPTQSRRDAAKRALEAAQKLQPESPETLLALGYYQVRVLRDYELAKTTFERVRKLLPGNSEILTALSLIALRQGCWNDVVAYDEQALVLDPRNADLVFNIAYDYTILRKFEAALKLADRALDIRPNDPELRGQKAMVYQALGNLRESAKWLGQVDPQTASVPVFAIKMVELNLERDHSKAVRLGQARLAQVHFRSDLERGVFTVFLALSQHLGGENAAAKTTAGEACKALEQVRQSQPDNDFAAVWLSRSYALLGKRADALKEAERAVALTPTDKDAVRGPGLEENLAAIQTMFGDSRGAISTLSRLLKTPYQSPFYGGPVTPSLLRLDPTWDPLRGDAQFEKLCQEERQ
jgi:TolB-like protein/Flp pilus assembly protein TadD